METAKRGVGAPATYIGEVREYIVALVKVHGATNARKILNANSRQNRKWLPLRDTTVCPKALGISMPTVLKFAHAAKVKLAVGRPKTVAAKVKLVSQPKTVAA